jgi:large repetitive protein
MSGSISSALLAINLLTGTNFAASGDSILLDKRIAMNPALVFTDTADHVIDATESTAVPLTVSGLEHGETETVTFTDASNHHVNAITVDPPMNLGDGSANASTGTPQLPNLLSSYATRPSWNIAGVDYAVGINAGVTLKDPLPNGSLAPALVALGGSYDSVNHIINFSGTSANNAIISGWDFSLHGGIGIHIGTANNVIIEDNNFAVGTNDQTPIDLQGGTATNIIVEYNNINGNGLVNRSIGQGLIESNSPSLTVQYNSILNAFSEDLVIGSISTTFDTTVQYNLIGNSGMGQSQGAHGDWVQILSGPGDNVTNMIFQFNTFIQSLPPATAQTQGISFNGNVGGNFLNEVVSNNTMIAAPNANVINTFVNSDMSWLNGTLTVSDNYIDPTGLQNITQWLTPVGGTGPYSGTTVTSNNVNMISGAYFASARLKPLRR